MDNKATIEAVDTASSTSYKIEDIYLKSDGSYLVTLDGYPYHATEAETPEVYCAIRSLIDSGVQCRAYIPPVTSEADIQRNELLWRDAEIQRVSWLRERHRDQLDMGLKTSLSSEQFSALLDYIQALRDWPQVDSFPATAKRPATLPWLAAITQ